MLFGLFYMDWTMLIVLPAIIIALIAQLTVRSAYSKYSRVQSQRGISGHDCARMILDRNGLRHIRIERISGELTDHFDPTAGVIRLSDGVYSGTSTAALGIAAHECGHAVQHAENYAPIKIRSSIIKITNIGSTLAMPIFLVGLLLAALSEIPSRASGVIMGVGILLYSTVAVFQIVTLPTEFNASRRALHSLEDCGILSKDEKIGARKVLSAAALTYVAALLTSLLTILRLIIIANGSSRSRR